MTSEQNSPHMRITGLGDAPSSCLASRAVLTGRYTQVSHQRSGRGESALEQMRMEGASYLVGTPRGRLSKFDDQLLKQPWKKVQDQIEVKLTRDGNTEAKTE